MKIVIFSGTTEGRQLSGMLCEYGFPHTVCVATEYGCDVMPPNPLVTVKVGRLDADKMTGLLRSLSFGAEDTVVDATHPYASDVSDNIRQAAQTAGCALIRIARDASKDKDGLGIYPDVEDFARYIDNTTGNILLTTGTKTLPLYCDTVSPETIARTYVRVLPAKESLDICEAAGIERAHIIAMQGPFSCEMNEALIREYDIKHLLTKDSGAAGGFDEKIRAAESCGVTCYVLARPYEEKGVDIYEAFYKITGTVYKVRRKISLVGTGMGDAMMLTGEAADAIGSADAVFGSARLLKGINARNKYEMYLARDIIGVLSANEDIRNAAILYSGDTGFYSGAKPAYTKIREWDKDADITVIPGISSVSAFAARLRIGYDDANIVSIHGRNSDEDIESAADSISHSIRTFVLMSGDDDVRRLAAILAERGVYARMIIGRNLSYEDEEISHLTASEAVTYTGEGVIIALVENEGMRGDEQAEPEDPSSNIPAVMIAAISSGSGKTMITTGLLEAIKDRGLRPVSFKCGPDYIDPMFHEKVLGIDSENLDTFFMDDGAIRKHIGSCGGDIAVIEGVMGIYDGLGPESIEGSCYETAGIAKVPIILTVNASGLGRTVLSVIKGILADDTKRLIKGIILNRMSSPFYERIESYLTRNIRSVRPDVAVLGHIPRNDELCIGSRYLGLTLPDEVTSLRERIGTAAKLLEDNCDLDTVIKTASLSRVKREQRNKLPDIAIVTDKIRLAVADDDAFCFYYRENLRLLEELGVVLEKFSPIHDETVPEGASGILIGGGYPELHLKELCANESMKRSVKDAILSGMPSLAECGGFMYLHDRINDMKNVPYDMAGLIEGECTYTGHLVNFGYVEVVSGPDELSLSGLRGHEFHYYDTTSSAADVILKKRSTGVEYPAMTASDGRLWGFAHFYYPSNIEAVKKFVTKMREYGNK